MSACYEKEVGMRMKARKIVVIIGIAFFIAFAVLFSLGLYRFLTVDLVSRPMVEFHEPLQDHSVPMGGGLVRFSARDREGIEHVELWVDGELYSARRSSLPEGSSPFPLVEMWQPETLGRHILTARAYNTNLRETTVSVTIEVIESPVVSEAPFEEEVPLATQDDGSTPAEGTEEDSEVPTMLIDPSIKIPPLEGFLTEPEVPFLGMVPRFNLGPDTIPRAGIPLEVEALYLEVDESYTGVYCYISLADSDQERVPLNEAEYFVSGPGNEWDIKRELAGDNKRTVFVEDWTDSLDIYLNCWGVVREEDVGAVYELGTLIDNHYSEDWDGHLIEQEVIGPSGWFRIGYQIHPPTLPEGSLPVPTLTHRCFYEPPYIGSCELTWDYPDTAREEIDGFIIMLNGEFLLDIGNSDRERWMISETYGTMPTCSRKFRYQAVAYKGDPILGEKSAPSNTALITGDTCYSFAKIHFEYINPLLLTGDEYSIPWVPEDLEIGGTAEDVDYSSLLIHEDADWDRENGCSFANLWANDQKIDVGSSDKWDCFPWAEHAVYAVAEQYGVTTDTIIEGLEDHETLTIGMNVYDDDEINDDKQCYGEYTYYPRDLKRIATQPSHEETYIKSFCESGGGCCLMQYTVRVIPMTPPSE